MNKLVIITTGLCRPEIHNISFSNIDILFKDLKMDILWFFNIDKISTSKITQEETKKNLEKLLKYNVKYYMPDKPCFFSAVQRLINNSSEFIDKKTCVLWLEDDWVINKKFKLIDIIDKYYCENCYISLVFNKLGSFPPFIMGYKLFNDYFKNNFKKYRKTNPEGHVRRIIRRQSIKNNVKCLYFLFNHPIPIKKKSFIDSVYSKEKYFNKNNIHYIVLNEKNDELIININKIKEQINDKKLEICYDKDYRQIIKNNPNDIIVIRIGEFKNTINYKNSYFKDIGREWQKIKNLNRKVLRGKDLHY